MRQKLNKSKTLAVLIVFILGVAVFYGNTLKNGFVADDHQIIETYDYIRSLKYLPKVIAGCIWDSKHNSCGSYIYYRPLMMLSYMLTYQVSSKLWVFHLVNLIYFSIAIFLVFILVKLLTKNLLIAFLSGFIFLIHPLNSEVANFVATASDTLYTIFVLSGTICYFLYRRQSNNSLPCLWLTYIFYTLGVFSKEPAVFLPLIFLTLDFFYFNRKWVWKNLQPYIIFTIILLIYEGFRFSALGSFGGVTGTIHKFIPAQSIYTFFYLFALYVQKSFWPYPLSFFYIFPSPYQFLSINFFIAILTMTGYIGLCFLAWKKRWKIVLFALIWFFVFLFTNLAFSHLIYGDNKFAERYAFASLIGFSILMAVGLEWLWKNWNRGKIAVIGLMSIVSLLSFLYIYNHNKVWQDDISLGIDTLKQNPESDEIRYNLTLAYRHHGNLEQAGEQLARIIQRGTWKDLYKAYYSLGDIYRQEGKYDLAMDNFQSAIKLNPYYKEAYNNIGALFLKRGDLLRSVLSLCQALLIDPQFTDANTNFNMAASAIQGMDNKSFMSLSDQILKEDIFKPSSSVIPANPDPIKSDPDLIGAKAGIHTNKSGDDQEKAQDIIRFKTKDCSLPQGCILIFSTRLKPDQTPFPFLIAGKTPSGEVVRTRYFEFNPQTFEIALGIDRKFEKSKIHFWLPACNGVYYETETR